MNVVGRFIQVGLLYCFYLVGSWLQGFLHIPLPGSIVGLVLMWGVLSMKLIPLDWVETGAYSLLSVLPLFFIPATVAVMNYGHFFSGKGILLLPITIISTFLTMGIASYISQTLAKRLVLRRSDSECN